MEPSENPPSETTPSAEDRRRSFLRRLRELQDLQRRIDRSWRWHPYAKHGGQALFLLMILFGLYAGGDPEARAWFYALGLAIVGCGLFLWWNRQQRTRLAVLSEILIEQIAKDYPEEVEQAGGVQNLYDEAAVEALVHLLKQTRDDV